MRRLIQWFERNGGISFSTTFMDMTTLSDTAPRGIYEYEFEARNEPRMRDFLNTLCALSANYDVRIGRIDLLDWGRHEFENAHAMATLHYTLYFTQRQLEEIDRAFA